MLNHPFRFELARQFLEVSQLCDQTRHRGCRRYDERLEYVVLVAAGLFRDPACTAAVSALVAGPQLERGQVGDVGLPVLVDQVEHGIDRIGGAVWPGDGHGSYGERADTGNAGAGCDGQETTARRIDRRVCGWRAKHAISLGHLDSRPVWSGLGPTRELAS